jgi:hypothetical protein
MKNRNIRIVKVVVYSVIFGISFGIIDNAARTYSVNSANIGAWKLIVPAVAFLVVVLVFCFFYSKAIKDFIFYVKKSHISSKLVAISFSLLLLKLMIGENLLILVYNSVILTSLFLLVIIIFYPKKTDNEN